MNYTVRNADRADLETVVSIFTRAIDLMQTQNIPQWDAIYPNRAVLSDDILHRNMYAVVDKADVILAVFVINQDSDPAYAAGNWSYQGDRYAVLHRLCVDPARQNRGIGSKTLPLIEALLRDLGYVSIRLDAFSLNPYSLRMYNKAGYTKVGEVQFRKGLFFLYEKVL